MVTVVTTERRELGPYEGQRIAGTSDDVVNVIVTMEYRYETFVIRVGGLPARYDRKTGRQYVSAQIGAPITRQVNQIADVIERSRAQMPAESLVRDVPVAVDIHAEAFLSAA